MELTNVGATSNRSWRKIPSGAAEVGHSDTDENGFAAASYSDGAVMAASGVIGVPSRQIDWRRSAQHG